MQGRHPNSNVIKMITGNPGRRPVENSDSELQVPPKLPAAPSHLSEFARAEWERIGPLLEVLGLVAEIDMVNLAIYCQAYGRWVNAELKMRALAEKDPQNEGLVVKTPNGYPQISPWLVIANKAMEQCKASAALFGMSPEARARVKAMARQGDLFGGAGLDPLQKFLQAGEKVS